MLLALLLVIPRTLAGSAFCLHSDLSDTGGQAVMARYFGASNSSAAQFRTAGNVYPDSKCPPLNDPSGTIAKGNCRPNNAYAVFPRDLDYCLMTHVIYAFANPIANPPPAAGVGNPYGGTGPNGYHTVENGYTAANGYSSEMCTPSNNPRGQDWGVCFKPYEVAPYEYNDISLYNELKD
jgi:hypothetical protein